MKRSIPVSSMAACLYLGLAAPLLAAEPAVTGAVTQSSPGEHGVSATKPAGKCLSDLHAFDVQMEKEGYWLGGSGYAFGHPIDGLRFDYPLGSYSPKSANDYQNLRPGYEVRILIASANILARHGQQQPCEDVLATTRDAYKIYVAGMHSRGVAMVDVPGWRQQQIADAQPVTSKNTSFRSDELLGTDVRNAKNEALGSVDDIVMNPQTNTIAYLVIGRGGIFGLDEKYVPVPWSAFKIPPNGNLLVLDTTKSTLDAAPQVSHDQFATPGTFDQESQKVDAYWKVQLSTKGNN